ncbi:unnamed protein product, partial [Polarella glacialis]
ANMISFALNLTGQSIVFDTDGSSSFAALFHAQLEQGAEEDADSAAGRAAPFSLVLGSAWNVAPACFANFCFRGLLTTQGRCCCFNEGASGFVRGEGCGALVLARLFTLSEQDSGAQCLVRSVEMMQSSGAASLTAPCGTGMHEVIDLATFRGGLRPGDIDVVECHAAGEMQADALEVQACERVLRQAAPFESKQPLPLTSFKSCIGSTYAASGLISLLKAVQCA